MKNILKPLHYALLALIITISSCKKDDDSSFEQIIEPTNDIIGSLWVQNGNDFSELDLKDTQETNAFTTLDSFRCTEFDGIFICTQGDITETKTLLHKGTFNGELKWTKDYVSTSEKYYRLKTTEVYQNTVVVGYSIVNSTTYTSTYHLEALNLENGDVKWSIELGYDVKRLTSLAGKIIAELSVGSSTKELISIDSNDGSIENRKAFDERIGKLSGGISSIFVMTWNKKVISMDHQLNFNWTFETDAANILGGIETTNQLLLYSRDQTVYSINKNTGTLEWKHTYFGDYPLAINTVNDKVYVMNRKENETDIQIKTLNLDTGEELDFYTYSTDKDWNASFTKFYLIDHNLLIFNSEDDEGKANIALINIKGKTLVWEKQLNQRSYTHMLVTPTGS